MIGARFVTVFALLGLFVSFLGRSGGGQHCPAGSESSCYYPHGPWHWGEGTTIGALIGLLVFLAWLAAQRFLE